MRLFPLVCLLIVHLSQARDDDDDEPYDPYTTTDPKKREPSPCEGKVDLTSLFTLENPPFRYSVINGLLHFNIPAGFSPSLGVKHHLEVICHSELAH